MPPEWVDSASLHGPEKRKVAQVCSVLVLTLAHGATDEDWSWASDVISPLRVHVLEAQSTAWLC
jgi:hypothetical protein